MNVKWTQKEPVYEGWYFVRHAYPDDKITIEFFYRHAGWWIFVEGDMYSESITFEDALEKGWYWSGPIQLPVWTSEINDDGNS